MAYSRHKMVRTLHGRVILKQLKGVLTGGKTPSRISLPASLPSVLPLLSFPTHSIQSVSCQHLHVASPQSCYHFLTVTPYPVLSSPLPSIPPFLRLAQLSTSPVTLKIRSKVDGEELMKRKKKQYDAPFITLIDTEDKISKMGLDQAERLAKRRDLKLVKVEDPTVMKSSNDVYKLMTGKQFYEEEVKAKKTEKKLTSGTKDEKTLAIGGNITQHDLAFKLHNITKWLSKGHQIKVTIASKKSTLEAREKVFSTIEEEIKKHKGRILQRHEKMNDIRFYIAPPKEKNTTSKEATQENDHASANESSNDQTK